MQNYWKRALVASLCLFVMGCAEFRNRGGTIDWLEDRILFRADGKGLRLIRSYALLAGLLRIAERAPMSTEERQEVAAKVGTALGYSSDAFACAYGVSYGAYGCVFFDDLMHRLDLTILRMARITFLPEENKELIAIIQKEMFGGIGEELAGGAAKLLDGAGDAAVAAGKGLNLAGALLRLGDNALRVGGRIGPIYRDSIELQMQIIMRALASRCRPAAPRNGAAVAAVADIDCNDLATTERLFANGAGDFSLWRAHARAIFAKYGSIIRPGREDFTQVSELIVRGCTGLLSGGAAADKCFKKDDVNRGLIFGEEAARRASTPQTVAIE